MAATLFKYIWSLVNLVIEAWRWECREVAVTVLYRVLQVGDIQLEAVSHFKYLGSILHQNGMSECDVKERIARDSRAIGMLRKPIFNDREHIK